MTDAGEVLAALAAGLAADSTDSGRKMLDVLRSNSSQLLDLGEEMAEDLVATSVTFIDILLAALSVEADLPWAEYDQRAREQAPSGAGDSAGVAHRGAGGVPARHHRAGVAAA